MMRYCPSCGTGHECDSEEGGREKAEVAITRLETNRDIEVARINAAAGVQIADSEAVQAAAHAEGVVEGAEAVIDAASPETIVVEDGPGPAAEPVEPEPEPEPEPGMVPPEVPPVSP